MTSSRSPESPNRNAYVWACLTILGLALMAKVENCADRAFATDYDLIPHDFAVLYMGGQAVLQRGAIPLYDPPTDRRLGYRLLYQPAEETGIWSQTARAYGLPEILRFTHPPFSALLMAPLAMLPWRWAFLIWQIIILGLTLASVYLTLRLLPSWPGWQTLSVIFAAVCFFYPFRNTIDFGQANVTILFTWTLGVYLLSRQRPMASALAFALGTVVKISPVVAVPLLAVRRQWRWLAAYVAGVVAFCGISIWRLGWQAHVTWLTAIYPAIGSGVGNVSNRSLAGLLDALLGPAYTVPPAFPTEWPVPPALAVVEKALGLAIGLGFIFWCWRKNRGNSGLVDELILLPLVYTLTAPFSWPHHFVLLVLPLTYLWAKIGEATPAERFALYLGTLTLGSELPIYLAAYSPWAGPHLIIAAIALWPAATAAILGVGMRMYQRSLALAAQPDVAIEDAAEAWLLDESPSPAEAATPVAGGRVR